MLFRQSAQHIPQLPSIVQVDYIPCTLFFFFLQLDFEDFHEGFDNNFFALDHVSDSLHEGNRQHHSHSPEHHESSENGSDNDQYARANGRAASTASPSATPPTRARGSWSKPGLETSVSFATGKQQQQNKEQRQQQSLTGGVETTRFSRLRSNTGAISVSSSYSSSDVVVVEVASGSPEVIVSTDKVICTGDSTLGPIVDSNNTVNAEQSTLLVTPHIALTTASTECCEAKQSSPSPSTPNAAESGSAAAAAAGKSKPLISSMKELITKIDFLLKDGRANADLDAIRDVMERYDASSRDWVPYTYWDSNCKYTRNLIHSDNKHYSLMLLCWNCHRESPIHNHPQCECFVRVVDGCVTEFRYDWPRSGAGNGDMLRCTSRIDCRAGDVTFMNDSMGLHKLCNTTQRGAVTLHLYFPPYNSCKMFLDGTAQETTGYMCFHTEHGCVVNNLD